MVMNNGDINVVMDETSEPIILKLENEKKIEQYTLETTLSREISNDSDKQYTIETTLSSLLSDDVDDDTVNYWIITALAGLASLFLLIYLILFLIKPGTKKLSDKVLASFSLGLFIVNFCGLFLPYIDNIIIPICYLSGAFMYYISLCRYCWMNIMAYDVWRALRLSTSKLRRPTGSQSRRFFLYCVWGWCLPLPAFIGMICIQFNHSDSFPKDWIPFTWENSSKQHCNLFNAKLLSIFYYGPIAVSFFMNIVLFSLAAKVMCKAKSGAVKPTNSEHQNFESFKLYVRLAVLLGVVCICFLVLGKNHVWDELHIVVAFLNLVQALAILIFFGCKRPPLLDRQNTKKSSFSLEPGRSFRKHKLASISSRGTVEVSLSSTSSSSEEGRHQSFRRKKLSITSISSSGHHESNIQEAIPEESINQTSVMDINL